MLWSGPVVIFLHLLWLIRMYFGLELEYHVHISNMGSFNYVLLLTTVFFVASQYMKDHVFELWRKMLRH